MFCHNCGFKIKDSELTECPECNFILSPGLSFGNDPGREEIFQDIENILNNDELSKLYENTAAEENSEREDPFDLDFETVNQINLETAANNEKTDKRSTFEEDDETGDEIEPKKASKFTFVLFTIFSLIIAAGAGVLYLKSKQPASPAFPKENASIYENKKSFPIKNEEIQPAVEKTDEGETPKISEQPTMRKASSANKKAGAISKKAEPKENKNDEKISEKDNSWTTYVPGKQSYYTIQVSSVSNRSFARANHNILKKKYPAYVLLTKNKEGKIIYKLRIGKYETAAKAKKAAAIFYKYEKMKYIILKSNADIDLQLP